MGKSNKFSFYVFMFTLVFFYIPLVMLVVFSFNNGKTFNWTGFSLKWYRELFFNSRSEVWDAFWNSIIVGFSSSIVATIIGTLGAIGIYWYNFKMKKYLQVVTYLPLIIPEIIVGVSLVILYTKMGLPLGLFTIFLSHVTFSIPFVMFIIMSRLEEFDYSIIEAAYDLGAKELQALLKVILPVTMPGIISGFLMALTLSFDDFVITSFVYGPGSATLPIYISNTIKRGSTPVLNVLSVLLILFSVGIAIISHRFQKYMFK